MNGEGSLPHGTHAAEKPAHHSLGWLHAAWLESAGQSDINSS
ncbi:hypothetical protein CHELA20_52833 [Hyphomicrobiales bacterium]|nr:hypothetical protein CHELA41_22092 [Hyphomicrobiales bacterium]CAH1683040.1 hypothetical protein CHELA20_52833 [Hyphomicrobiales bacterium]